MKFLTDEEQPTPRGPLPIFSYSRDQSFTAEPRILSFIPEGTDISEAQIGSTLLNLGLFEQGKQIAAVMNATGENGLPLYSTVGIEMSRRSAKTTAIWATLIGRCLKRPGYSVVTTAQDGMRAREKLKEIMKALLYADFEGKQSPGMRMGRLYWGAGQERIEFDNGSFLWVVPPDPGAFRSKAADVILIDEAGELDPEKADALQAGALPLMDTRPGGQIIIAGTPNTLRRAGILWDTIKELEDSAPHVGGVIYSAGETESFIDMSDPDNPVYDMELLRKVHPGIACGLTTEAIVLSRLAKMGIEKWGSSQSRV